MKTATYTKLKTGPKAGEWGLRVAGEVEVGEVVLASTQAGKKSRKAVTAIVWQGNGVSIVEMGNAPKAAPKAVAPVADDEYEGGMHTYLDASPADLPY